MGGKYPRNVAVRSRAVNQPELKWIFTSLGSYMRDFSDSAIKKVHLSLSEF